MLFVLFRGQKIWEAFRVATASLRANKLRTGLTLIGIVVGVGISLVIPRMLGWPTLVSFVAILGSVVFSAAVGIFFGYYPARKAAALDPIDALRYE